jgi:hypothetical protein
MSAARPQCHFGGRIIRVSRGKRSLCGKRLRARAFPATVVRMGRLRLDPNKVLTATERGRRFRARRAGLAVPAAPTMAQALVPILGVEDFGPLPTMADVFAALAPPPLDHEQR